MNISDKEDLKSKIIQAITQSSPKSVSDRVLTTYLPKDLSIATRATLINELATEGLLSVFIHPNEGVSYRPAFVKSVSQDRNIDLVLSILKNAPQLYSAAEIAFRAKLSSKVVKDLLDVLTARNEVASVKKSRTTYYCVPDKAENFIKNIIHKTAIGEEQDENQTKLKKVLNFIGRGKKTLSELKAKFGTDTEKTVDSLELRFAVKRIWKLVDGTPTQFFAKFEGSVLEEPWFAFPCHANSGSYECGRTNEQTCEQLEKWFLNS